MCWFWVEPNEVISYLDQVVCLQSWTGWSWREGKLYCGRAPRLSFCLKISSLIERRTCRLPNELYKERKLADIKSCTCFSRSTYPTFCERRIASDVRTGRKEVAVGCRTVKPASICRPGNKIRSGKFRNKFIPKHLFKQQFCLWSVVVFFSLGHRRIK